MCSGIAEAAPAAVSFAPTAAGGGEDGEGGPQQQLQPGYGINNNKNIF